MVHYNGYTPSQREAKGRARAREAARNGGWTGPCAMCGDPTGKFWLHSEDYAIPYKWDEPAAYVVCDCCHKRLHARFRSPERWRAYWRFLEAGWFAREVTSHHLDTAATTQRVLATKRRNARAQTDPWWKRLTLDRRCTTPDWPSPRQGLSLDGILDFLNEFQQRATYAAVADLLCTSQRSLMRRRAKNARHSWIVSSRTLLPTGYQREQMHSQLTSRTAVLMSVTQLQAWLADVGLNTNA